MVNSSVNFIIYCAVGSRFRAALTCRLVRWRRAASGRNGGAAATAAAFGGAGDVTRRLQRPLALPPSSPARGVLASPTAAHGLTTVGPSVGAVLFPLSDFVGAGALASEERRVSPHRRAPFVGVDDIFLEEDEVEAMVRGDGDEEEEDEAGQFCYGERETRTAAESNSTTVAKGETTPATAATGGGGLIWRALKRLSTPSSSSSVPSCINEAESKMTQATTDDVRFRALVEASGARRSSLATPASSQRRDNTSGGKGGGKRRASAAMAKLTRTSTLASRTSNDTQSSVVDVWL